MMIMTNTDKIQIQITHKNTQISKYKIPKHTNANLLQKELKISLDPLISSFIQNLPLEG